MMTMIQQLHWLRPGWLLLIVPLIIVFLLLLRSTKNTSHWQQICAPHLQRFVLIDLAGKQQRWPLLLLILAWLIASIALAGPSWQKLPQPAFENQSARIIALSLSPSMLSEDIPPSRLVRARYKISDLLDKLSDGQTGLIAFAKEPYVVSPLTRDKQTILNLAPELSPQMMPVTGRDIGRALTLSAQLLKQANHAQGEIILITDGAAREKDLLTAKKIKQQGYRTLVLAVGTEKGKPIKMAAGNYMKDKQGSIIVSRLDRDSLQQLAQAGGGVYADFSHDKSDLDKIVSAIKIDPLSMQSLQQKALVNRWLDEGNYFIIALLPLVAFGFRRGWFTELCK